MRFNDGNQVPAEIVGFDPFADVALLKVDPEGLTLRPLPLGSARDVNVGAPVAAIGSPFGEEQSLSVGVVSATRPLDRLADRLRHRRRDPDRRRDQPRQLRRPAARRARARARHQLPDPARRAATAAASASRSRSTPCGARSTSCARTAGRLRLPRRLDRAALPAARRALRPRRPTTARGCRTWRRAARPTTAGLQPRRRPRALPGQRLRRRRRRDRRGGRSRSPRGGRPRRALPGYAPGADGPARRCSATASGARARQARRAAARRARRLSPAARRRVRPPAGVSTFPARAAARRRRLQDPGRLHAHRRTRSHRGDPRARRAPEGRARRARLGDRVRRRRERDPLHARAADEGRRPRRRVAGHLRPRGVLQRDEADAQRAAGRARGPDRRAVGHLAALQRDERARARRRLGRRAHPRPAAGGALLARPREGQGLGVALPHRHVEPEPGHDRAAAAVHPRVPAVAVPHGGLRARAG